MTVTHSRGTALNDTVAVIDTIRVLYDRARVANDTGRPALAIRDLHRALALLDRFEGPDATPEFLDRRVRVFLALSTAEFERGGAEVARAHAERALALSAHDAALQAMSHSQLATVWGRSDQPRRARAELDLAAAGLTLLPAREQWVILINRGMVSLDLADVRRAERDFTAAAELAAEHGLASQEFMARHNLGYAAYVAGDLPRALSLMAAADAMPDDTSRAASRLDHGRVLLEAGLVREAIALLSDARQLCERDGLRQLRGETDVELSRGYLMNGRYELAIRHARSARQSFRRRGAQGWRAWAQLWEWSAMLAQPNRPARWGAVAEQVERIADTEQGTRLGLEAALTAAQMRLRLGQVDAAKAWLRRAEPLAGAGSLSSLLRMRLTQADAACAAGDTRGTTRLLRRAARELSAAQSNSGSLDVRTATALHGVALAQFELRLAHGRGARAVLTATERWRASSARLPAVRPPDDPQLAAHVAELRSLSDQQRDQRGGGSLEDVARARRLEQTISRRGWMLAGSGGMAAAGSGGPAASREAGSAGSPGAHVRDGAALVGLAQARDLLRSAGATLVSYFPLDGRLGAVVLTEHRIRLYDVADLREVTESIRRLDADLRVVGSLPAGEVRSAVWASLAADLRRVEQQVLTGLRVDGRGVHGRGVEGRLVVVPCAAIEGLPWGMLPSRAGQPTTVAQSLTAWARTAFAATASTSTASASTASTTASTTAVSSTTASTAAGSDPMTATPTTSADPAPPAGGVVALSGPELGSADREVADVAAVWAGAGTAYPDGTTADLTAALTSADIVHVAAHGLHHPQSPLFSSVRMVDGPLFTFDLQRTGVGAGHVVLSACDVGQSAWRPGEERLGLAAGLLALGAANVVASVCRIPDEVAGAVMPAYHRRLAAGMEAAEALAAACEGADPMAGAFIAMGGPWRAPGAARPGAKPTQPSASSARR